MTNPRGGAAGRKSLALPVRADQPLDASNQEKTKSGRNSLPQQNMGLKGMMNNKRSISWGTKIIQEYDPGMQRRSQVQPSLMLNESQNKISLGGEEQPKRRSAFKNADRQLNRADVQAQIQKIKRLSQIAIIRQYEEPIVKGEAHKDEIDSNSPTPNKHEQLDQSIGPNNVNRDPHLVQQ